MMLSRGVLKQIAELKNAVAAVEAIADEEAEREP